MRSWRQFSNGCNGCNGWLIGEDFVYIIEDCQNRTVVGASYTKIACGADT
ncbi:hypothetical protein [Dulcicalothrix desertica]|nr:hypothetical protein [Dulcicalothrix desertica]